MAIDIAHREFVPIFAFKSEPPAPLQAFEEEALEGNKNQNNAALLRPKSSPSVAHSNKSSSSQIRRPKTAHPNLRQYECDRVYQVEHEPTRRHKMENHLPLQRNRPPPWQKSLDGQMSTLVVAPGYILSRSKSKYNMTMKTEEFFDGHQNEEKQRLKFVDPEKDALIGQLQQQINDLTLYLEEERMNHRQSRFKGNQALKDKAEELEKLHQEKIKKLDEEHEQELEEQHAIHSKEFGKYRTAAESQINRMKSETEFLQGAFDSYKGTLHTEMDERWKKKEDEFRQHHEEIKQQALHELKTKLISERNAERVSLQKEGQKHVEAIRRENKKELDALQKRFSNAAADLERLKNVQSELKDLKTEHEVLQMRYEETVSQLKKASNELTDTRVRLLTFEEQFEDKVGEVDDKYKQMMHELMSQNTELRRLYVKKCGELFDEKALSEKTRIDKLRTAKETMQTLTEIRNRSQISLVGGLPPTPESASPTRHQKFTEMSEQQRRRERRNNPPRPVSAPMTKTETKTAVQNAGEMDDLKRPEDLPIRPHSSLPATRPDVEEMRQQLFELQNLSLSDKLFEALG